MTQERKGSAYFDLQRTRFAAPWIAGVWLREGVPIDAEPSVGVTIRHAHSGRAILSRPFRADDRPRNGARRRWTVALNQDWETEWLAFERAQAGGTWVYWSDGSPQVVTFDATTGGSYALPTPKASGVVPTTGWTPSEHPDLVWLDGVLDPAAATLSGSTLSALKTGTITASYCAVYRVVVGPIPQRHAAHNDIQSTIVLDEARLSG